MIKTRTALLATAAIITLPIAFETGKPGWKMDGDKLALDASGNPIFIKADGTETSVAGDTISRLNGEAKTHRERAEKAEADLKKFEGITDPAAAVKALETVSKLDAKKLIDAGEVDKLKGEISKTYEAQIADKDKALAAATERADNLVRTTAFATSDFIRERVAVPPEMFQATFQDRFKVEDGKLVPYGADGNKIYSKKRMGEVADVDEAFEILLETYPHKDTVLKAPSAGGSGSGGGGGSRGGGRTISRADFQKLPPADQAAAAASAGKGEMTIID
jgi:hypothetical protein